MRRTTRAAWNPRILPHYQSQEQLRVVEDANSQPVCYACKYKLQTPNDLGYLVRTHRKNKQLTLETFAELSHLSMQFLSDFEQGKNTGEIEKILKALQTLGLEIVVQPCGARPGHTD